MSNIPAKIFIGNRLFVTRSTLGKPPLEYVGAAVKLHRSGAVETSLKRTFHLPKGKNEYLLVGRQGHTL